MTRGAFVSLIGSAEILPSRWLGFGSWTCLATVFVVLILPTACDTVLLLGQALVFSWIPSSQESADWIWDATDSISLGFYACTLAWLMLKPLKRLPILTLATASWLFSFLGMHVLWLLDQLIENVYVNHLPGSTGFRDLFASLLICRLFFGYWRLNHTTENQSQLLDLLVLIAFAAMGAYQFSVYEFNKGLFLQQTASTILCGMFAFATTLVFKRIKKNGIRCALIFTACIVQAFTYFGLLELIYMYADYDYDLVRTNPWIFSIGLLFAAILALPALQRVGELTD